MAIHVTGYAAPLVGGTAYVAPEPTVAALRGTAALLADAPKAVQLVICVGGVPGAGESETDGEVTAPLEAAARSVFRRAAVAATTTKRFTPGGGSGPAVERQSLGLRRAVGGFGWLLLLTGGTFAAGLAGLWLAMIFPFLRRRTLHGADPARGVAALSHALESAPVLARAHAGLTSLTQVMSAGDASGHEAGERYRQAATMCPSLGLGPLADFYEALGRGAVPTMVWAQITAVEKVGDGSVHEPA